MLRRAGGEAVVVNIKRWAALLLLAAGVYAYGRGCDAAKQQAGDAERPPGGRSGTPVAAASGAGGGAKGTTAARSPARPTASEGMVVRVRDGDSIVVMRGGIGVEVRLDGIDCPELAQPFGGKAKSFTAGLAFGKTVRLAGKGKDRYGRELAEVFLPDGTSLNRELVSAGYAWWYRKYSTDRSLEGLELTARQERHGLWAGPNPVPPWEFRAGNQRGPSGGR